MTENITLDAVRQSVTVRLSQERAFGLFVDEAGALRKSALSHRQRSEEDELLMELVV